MLTKVNQETRDVLLKAIEAHFNRFNPEVIGKKWQGCTGIVYYIKVKEANLRVIIWDDEIWVGDLGRCHVYGENRNHHDKQEARSALPTNIYDPRFDPMEWAEELLDKWMKK